MLACLVGVLILFVAATGSAASSVNHKLGINSFIVGKTRSSSARAYSYVELKQMKFALGLELFSEYSSLGGRRHVRGRPDRAPCWTFVGRSACVTANALAGKQAQPVVIRADCPVV